MTNLINTYSDKVEFKVWMELDESLQSCEVRLRTLIELDEKPNRQRKARNAFEKLLKASSDSLEKKQILAQSGKADKLAKKPVKIPHVHTNLKLPL